MKSLGFQEEEGAGRHLLRLLRAKKKIQKRSSGCAHGGGVRRPGRRACGPFKAAGAGFHEAPPLAPPLAARSGAAGSA